MKEPKASIFNLARTTPARAPLADLLKELQEFRPPEKSPALLAVEEARRKAGQEQDRASKAYHAMCAIARGQDDGSQPGKQGQKRVSAADILAAQELVRVCDSKLQAAREAEEAASLAWRRAYTTEVFELVGPARAALHSLCDEIQSAMTLFRALANRTAAVNVGAPWIVREAETLIAHLRVLRDHLTLDSKL